MFLALNARSPRVDIPASDVFSVGSQFSDAGDGEGESGLPPAEEAQYDGAGAGGMSDDERVAEAVDAARSYYDEPEQPTPAPPSPPAQYSHSHLPYVSYSAHQQAYHLSTSPYAFAGARPTDSTLSHHLDLFAQFLPLPSSETYIPPAAPTPFPPSPSGVYAAHAALRSAISAPHFQSTEYGHRHHPYSRSTYLPRSSSTASLRYVSQASSSVSMAPSSLHPRSVSSLSTFSASSVPSFGVCESTSSFSQPTSRSASGASAPDQLYSPAAYEPHGTSRYFDSSTSVPSALAYLAEGAEEDEGMAMQPKHLFMSGLGLSLHGHSAEEAEARRVADEAAWKGIKGGGIMGDAEESDESEEDEEVEEVEEGAEMMDRYLNERPIPGTSDVEFETDAGADSDTDTPLAHLQARTRAHSPIFPASPTVLPTPTPVPRYSQPDPEADLSLVPSQVGGKKYKAPRKKVVRRRGARSGGSAAKAAEMGVEVRSLEQDEVEALQQKREEALSSGAGAGLEVEVEAGEEEELAAPAHTHSEVPITTQPSSETSAIPQPLTQGTADLALPLESPTSSLEVEVEYHPSGRPKRSATARSSLLYIKSEPSDTPDEQEGEDEQDAGDWLDEDGTESTSDLISREGTPLSSIKGRKSRGRGGRARTVKLEEGSEGRAKRVDPEIWAKVESLRERLMEPGKRTGNFDEKLCQLLKDERFCPGLITWNEAGDKVVIGDFEAFWVEAGPYVMCAQTKRSAFDKQLSNHGFKRETTTSSISSYKVCKTLAHPMLTRDDDALWTKVAALGALTKWGKGTNVRTGSSRSSRPSSLSTLRQTIVERDTTIAELTARVEAMQVDKERSLEAFARVCPEAWTGENVLAIFGIPSDEIPNSLPSFSNPSAQAGTPTLLDNVIASASGSSPAVDDGKKVTRKRSRQGARVVLAAAKEGAEEVIEEEADAEVEVRKVVGRKRSKLVLAGSSKK